MEVDLRTAFPRSSLAALLGYHLLAMAGLYLLPAACQPTLLLLLLWEVLGVSETAGAHRLWAHRSYTATAPLKLFLLLGYVVTRPLNQFSIYTFVLLHRTHHKEADTGDDPHSPVSCSFLHAHCTWLLKPLSPGTIKAAATIDMDDIKRDRLLMLEHRYHTALHGVFSWLVPVLLPLLWGEDLIVALSLRALQQVITMHRSGLIGSASHRFGSRPYDKNMEPRDSALLSLLCGGEGFHNYHHTFPWDYSTSEWGTYCNVATAFLDVMWWMGLAKELKAASPAMVASRAGRTGDISLTRAGGPGGHASPPA